MTQEFKIRVYVKFNVNNYVCVFLRMAKGLFPI